MLARLLKIGKAVLLPVGDNQRYDLVTEEAGRFVRIQCKSGLVKGSAVVFSTCSTHGHRGGTRRDYRGQADLFGVFVPELDKVYMVPVEAVGSTRCYLRLGPSKIARIRGVHDAAKYEI